MRRLGIRAALVAVDAFAAATATGGGIALVVGLERERFPPELLESTPFSSYRMPGLILAGAVGGSATIAAATALREPGIGGLASVAAGGVMMGWIAGEVLLLRHPSARSWVEALYFGVGLTMAGLGMALRHAE